MSLTSSYPQLLRRILALLTAVVLMSWGTAALSSADAVENNDQVCSGLDSGKIDLSGEDSSITVTAPAGQLITGYCVKAASEQNGGGPEYVTLSEPQKSVTISHSTGKGISHYSLDYGTAPEECPDGDHNGDMDGCEAPPEECPDGDHNGDMDGCEAPPEECPDGDHNGDMDGCEAPPEECPDGDHNGDMDGCGTPPEECPDGDHNGDMDGCEAPPEECPDGDHNGDMDGCEAPPEECPDGDHNGDMDGCGTPPEECPDGDHNGDMDGCGTPPEECPDGDHNGDMDGCGTPPEEGEGDVCEEGPHEGLPIPDDQTEEEFCGEDDGDGPDGPGGPGGPGGNNPGGNNPGGNNPGGNDAGGTEVLGAQASIGAGAPSGAGSSAPSAGAAQVPTVVDAGIEGPDATPNGLRSALALLMVAFGLFVFGMAITPSRRTNPRHRQS